MTRTASCYAFASVMLAGTPAAAQEADEAEAIRLFEEGVRLLDQRRFGEAADLLTRSRAIRETASALYNLGLAHRGMGRYRAALADFEEFRRIAAAGNPATGQAAAIMAELRAALGQVRLVVRGGATDVQVDEEHVGSADDLYQVDVDPGAHIVRASRPGYRPAERPVQLGRGERVEVELDASSDPLPASLVVDAGHPEAEILIDGEVAGTGRFERIVPARSYAVEVRAPGREPQRRVVDLRPGARERVGFALGEESGRASGEESGLLGSWWFWAGAALVVAGGVAGVLVLTEDEPKAPEPDGGTLGLVVVAILP